MIPDKELISRIPESPVVSNSVKGACRSQACTASVYDKIIYFNYNGASRSKKAAHATSVLNFNGITAAPAARRPGLFEPHRFDIQWKLLSVPN